MPSAVPTHPVPPHPFPSLPNPTQPNPTHPTLPPTLEILPVADAGLARICAMQMWASPGADVGRAVALREVLRREDSPPDLVVDPRKHDVLVAHRRVRRLQGLIAGYPRSTRRALIRCLVATRPDLHEVLRLVLLVRREPFVVEHRREHAVEVLVRQLPPVPPTRRALHSHLAQTPAYSARFPLSLSPA